MRTRKQIRFAGCESVQPCTCHGDFIRVSSWKSWAAERCTVTKGQLTDCGAFIYFFSLSLRSCCVLDKKLCPEWPLRGPLCMAYWPECNQRAPVSAPGMAVRTFCHVWGSWPSFVDWLCVTSHLCKVSFMSSATFSLTSEMHLHCVFCYIQHLDHD